MPASRSIFSSDKERGLWLWTVAVLVAIYSTLGLAPALADALRERNLLRITLAVALLLVAGPVAWRWVKGHRGWGEIGAVLGVVFAYWMAWVRAGSWEERTHLLEYGIVAALIHQALLERQRNGRPVQMPAATAVATTALLGLLDECIQAVLPNRVFDIRDVGFNALAGFLVVAARLAMAPQRRPGWRVWFLWLMACSIGWGWAVYWGWYDGTEPKTLESVPADMLAGYLGLIVGGIVLGLLQWLVLRHYVKQSARWVLASLGAAAFVGLVILGVGTVDRDLGWILGVSAFGTTVGLFQWAVLRDQYQLAGWWVLASTVGWVLGMPAGDVNGPPGLGAVYGAITATVLVWLLRQRHSGARLEIPHGVGTPSGAT